MEMKSRSAFGGLWGMVLLLLTVCVAGFFLYNRNSQNVSDSFVQEGITNQEAQESVSSADKTGQEAMKQAGTVKQSAFGTLPNGQKSPDCVDYRDGGEDIYIKGSTYSQGKLREEYCNFADPKPNTHVSEFSCTYEDPLADHWIECRYGCRDGACLRGPTEKLQVDNKQAATVPATSGGVQSGTN